MKKDEKNIKSSLAEEPATPYMRNFSSQEEAERFNMIENLQKSDIEKFQSFCNMLRMQRIYQKAKVYDMKDVKQ